MGVGEEGRMSGCELSGSVYVLISKLVYSGKVFS